MTRYFIILSLCYLGQFIVIGQEIVKNQKKYYFSDCDFGDISNKIENEKLDSIILKIPYRRLIIDTGYSSQINDAIKILSNELVKNNLQPQKFFIQTINCYRKDAISFELEYLDTYIYYYNIYELNKELATHQDKNGEVEVIYPVTGDICGHDGTYTVDLINKKIKIIPIE